jgi:hypothetical protein
MRRLLISLIVCGFLAPMPLMSLGCDDTVEHDKKVETKNGTTVTKEKKVTQSDDGTVTKTEEKKVTNP